MLGRMGTKTLAIVGCGKLATIITDALIGGFTRLSAYRRLFSYSRKS